MPLRIDGWALMARIAASPAKFAACDATVSLAALLLVRSQLVQGVASKEAVAELAAVVGPEVMIEVIQHLAGYEALRIGANLEGVEGAAERRTPEAVRRWLIEMIQSQGQAAGLGPPPAAPAREPAMAPPPPARALRRHRAMGARRIRPAPAS